MPGTSTTYTIVVSNAGPSTAVAQQVTDVFPAAITAVSWTAVASAGSSVAAASGTGNIVTTVTLLPGGTATFTAVAQISPRGHRLVDQHRHGGRAARGHHPGNNSCHRQRQPDPQTGLRHHQDRRADHAAVPGTSTTYTIVGQQRRPCCRRHRAPLSDLLPAGVTAAT